MKVLIIVRQLTGGGAERVATNLATALSEHTDVVLAVFNGDKNTYGSTVKTIDMNMPAGKGMLKFPWHIKAYRKIKEIKRKENITHSISFLAEPDLANVLSKGNDTAIVSVRNKCSNEKMSKTKYHKDRWTFKKADKIVALSKMVKFDLVEEFGIPEEKIIPIYNSCYADTIRAKAAEDVLSDDEKSFFEQNKGSLVISAGRLVPQKGQWHLVRAFKRVTDQLPDAKLVILGQGAKYDYLRELITNLKLENNVFLYGYKANPYAYLCRADLFAFPSVFEGLGNILIECMACGVPVVSADCPYGPKELLAPDENLHEFVSEIDYAEYGVLVPPMDETEYTSDDDLTDSEIKLADAIVEMMRNKELRLRYKEKITQRGNDFLPDVITSQWLDVLNEGE